MLIKNEEEHLKRSLPEWAKIVDYWIVGVDSNNTDNSPAVIQKYLGHIPGEMVTVDFDGMGKTWTKLVRYGLSHYPQATHGIMSDADFTPLTGTWKRSELDLTASKHFFVVIEADRSGTRTMDWIYRNIPGVEVLRRTHQILVVPKIPGQREYAKELSLHVQEHAAGFQDRAGNKSGRYIDWLLKDLEEYPGDSRTIYYLAKEHMDLMGGRTGDPVREIREGGPGAYHVHKALEYYIQRAEMEYSINVGEKIDEERYWSMLKAAEICERYTFDHKCCLKWWTRAWELDPPRADAVFYIGQHYRLRRDGKNAVKYLRKAAALPMPKRKNYQWPELYNCLVHLELMRGVYWLKEDEDTLSGAAWKDIKKSYTTVMTNCELSDRKDVGMFYDKGKRVRDRTKKEKQEKEGKSAGKSAGKSEL